MARISILSSVLVAAGGFLWHQQSMRGALTIATGHGFSYATYDPYEAGPSTADAIEVALHPVDGCLVIRDASEGPTRFPNAFAVVPNDWQVSEAGVTTPDQGFIAWGQVLVTSSGVSDDSLGRWDREAAGQPCIERLGRVQGLME